MGPETPLYMSPTRASLGRVTQKPSKVDTLSRTARKEKAEAKRLEEKRQIMRSRITSAERIRQLVPPSEKWPTVSSVEMYRRRLLMTEPAVAFVSKHSIHAPAAVSVAPSKFPFPILSAKDLPAFPQFGLLPTELRLQIWEQAVFNPKFIEIQFYDSPDYSPYSRMNSHVQIVNHRRYDPLTAVCQESRQVAQALAVQTECILVPRASRSRNPQPAFAPERDTVFFRPMDDLSVENRIQKLPSMFAGLNRVKHLAIPLDLNRTVPDCMQYVSYLRHREFKSLETLTFVLGCEEKSWLGDASIELRDLKQWCADGRKRTVKMGDQPMIREHGDHCDISDLSHRLVTEDRIRYDSLTVGDLRPVNVRAPLNVRVVAWKRRV